MPDSIGHLVFPSLVVMPVFLVIPDLIGFLIFPGLVVLPGFLVMPDSIGHLVIPGLTGNLPLDHRPCPSSPSLLAQVHPLDPYERFQPFLLAPVQTLDLYGRSAKQVTGWYKVGLGRVGSMRLSAATLGREGA